MNPQNKPLPKRPPSEPKQGEKVPVQKDGSVDEGARLTTQDQEHANYGGEHFDLKSPEKRRH